MNPNDKTTSAEQDPLAQPDHVQNANQSHQTSRRRLLKAATVAPIIYTLPSGGALAASSTTCLGDTDNIITSVTKEEETGNLEADGQVFTPAGTDNDNEYHNDGKNYIYDGNETLVAGSCWNSINLSSTKSFDEFI